jgi:hypothetical protein
MQGCERKVEIKMSLKKGSKFNNGYATVLEDEGVNYREIADIMTNLGFIMNHSSARNHVLRVMKKFAEAFDQEWKLGLDEKKLKDISCSPNFQNVIADLLHSMEKIPKP